MTSLYNMYLMLIDGCPRYLPLFGVSYVVICHLEVKLLKYIYKNFVQSDVYFWWIIVLDDLTSAYMMYLMYVNGCPRISSLFWCKLCDDLSNRTKIIKI